MTDELSQLRAVLDEAGIDVKITPEGVAWSRRATEAAEPVATVGSARIVYNTAALPLPIGTKLYAGRAPTDSQAGRDALDAAADTRRLDWLLPNLHPATWGMEFPGGYEWDSDAEFLAKWRAAIDAEMRRQSTAAGRTPE